MRRRVPAAVPARPEAAHPALRSQGEVLPELVPALLEMNPEAGKGEERQNMEEAAAGRHLQTAVIPMQTAHPARTSY